MMRNYAVPQFFRQVPNALLKRCFDDHSLLSDVDFSKLPEAQPAALVAAWDALSDEARARVEPHFLEIFDLACEKGVRAILDEARWQMRNDGDGYRGLVEKLAGLNSHYERAVTVFLDHRDCWKGATRFFRADTLSFWRKRRGLPMQPAAIDLDSRVLLASEVGRWFRENESRGRNCVVELLRRDTRDYFFVYPEDFANEVIEWEAGRFARRPHRPAFEVVYVWSASDGTLDVNHRGGRKAMEPLQAIFARTILKLDALPPNPKDERIYDLNRLKRRDFAFVWSPDSGIESVHVRKLRLSSMPPSGDRLTLEADTADSPMALYDLIEQVARALPLEHWNATQAEIVARLAATADKPTKTESFRLTWPNSCSLKYDETGLKLRAMLVASGIEPQ